MNRIIINNETDLSDEFALEITKQVVILGRISNNERQYCYLSTFKKDEGDYQISSSLTKKGDSFKIIKV